MFKKAILFLSLVPLTSFGPFAATITIEPVADTSLFETTPDENFGAAELASGTTAQGLKSRALIKFDLAGRVPSGATITSVSVTVKVTKAPPAAVASTFGLHRVLQDWGEGTKNEEPATSGEATWKARFFPSTTWSAPGAAAAVDYMAKASSAKFVGDVRTYVFDSTADLVADVRAWLANPTTNFGWILISQSESIQKTARRFGSSESSANTPILAIEYAAGTPATAPSITVQPQNQTIAPGGTVTFTVVATGTATLTYQWRFNGADIPNATSPNLTLNNVQAPNAGAYTVVVGNSAGSVTSNAAVLSLVNPPASSGKKWTIMIYGHGDHNLTGTLVGDIQEMETVGSGPDFNVVLQADFDASSAANVAGGLPANLANGVTRFLINKDNNRRTVSSTVVERLPELNMDDPKMITDFITWAAQRYPADRYGLIMWNHGGQWQGFGGDSQDGTLQDKGILSTAQIRQAVGTAMQNSGIAKWEFVSFDTCLMGGAEVLTDFVPLTDVFIACPEIDYGDGWDYEGAFNFLKTNPTASAMDFGRAEVKAWEAHHMLPGNESDLALGAHALYDLTKYAAFEEKFNAFASLLRQSAAPQNLALPRLRLDTTQYSLEGVKDIGKPTDFIDLGELADRLMAEPTTDGALRSAAANLVTSIDAMVVAKVRGSKKQLTHGLSVYYPVEGAKGDPSYASLTLSSKPGSAWVQFLTKVSENKAGDDVAPEIVEADLGPAGFQPAGAPAPFSASITQPATMRVRIVNGADAYAIYASIVDNHFTAKTNEYVYLGEIIYAPVNGVGTYNIQWNGTLPMLSNTAATNAVVLGGFFDDVDSDTLVSYAEYTPPGSKDAQIVALLTKMNGAKGQVIEVLDAEVEDLAPEGVDVEPGGTLTPLYYLERRVGDDPENWEGDDARGKSTIVIPTNGLAGLTVNAAQLPAGVYTMEAQVIDVYENESDVLEYRIAVGTAKTPLKVAIQAIAAGKIRISWPASASDYTLETNSALSSTGWSAVSPNLIVIDGSNKTFTDNLSGSVRFYRLKGN